VLPLYDRRSHTFLYGLNEAQFLLKFGVNLQNRTNVDNSTSKNRWNFKENQVVLKLLFLLTVKG
jgi:hypothetical protein